MRIENTKVKKIYKPVPDKLEYFFTVTEYKIKLIDWLITYVIQNYIYIINCLKKIVLHKILYILCKE